MVASRASIANISQSTLPIYVAIAYAWAIGYDASARRDWDDSRLPDFDEREDDCTLDNSYGLC